MKKKIVLSGMRPTGRLTLGNYWGALKNWLELQDKHECFFFVADWHALTTGYDRTENIRSNTTEMVIDWLAAGLDPEKCCIFRQSMVMEHAELALMLGMITPVSWLLRNPTYKEQLLELYRQKYAGQKKNAEPAGKMAKTLAETVSGADEEEIAAQSELSTHGFLGYPVLQAADILTYHADLVPVGQDQLPHLELTRDIARRFSDIYGQEILKEPHHLLTSAPKVPGLDGRKMSKSYGNFIEMGEDLKSLEEKIKRMYTDPLKARATDKGHPDGCVVCAFHKLYNPDYKKRWGQCEKGETGCVACKKELFTLMSAPISEFSRKRKEYSPALAESVLEKGSARAREIAAVTMQSVRKAMRLR